MKVGMLSLHLGGNKFDKLLKKFDLSATQEHQLRSINRNVFHILNEQCEKNGKALLPDDKMEVRLNDVWV